MPHFPVGIEEILSTQFPEGEESDLGPTWSVIDSEPGMDDLAGTAGDILKTMKEDLKIFPYQDKDEQDRLFLARFEFPKFREDYQFPEAVFAEDPTTVGGWIDFLAGFPIDCVEMLVAIGEFSSKAREGEDSK